MAKSPADREPQPIDPESLVGKEFSGRISRFTSQAIGTERLEQSWTLAQGEQQEQREVTATLKAAERRDAHVRFEFDRPLEVGLYPRRDYLVVYDHQLPEFARSLAT